MFQSALLARFGARISFVRSSWSGRNSQKARLDGQEKLRSDFASNLRTYPNSIHILAAHSHGGNTALYALNDPLLNRHVSGLVCMGTPFISRRPRNIVMPSILFASSCAGMTALLIALLLNFARNVLSEHALHLLSRILIFIVLSAPASAALSKRRRLTFTRLFLFVSYAALALSVTFDHLRSIIESSWLLSHLAGVEIVAAELFWIAGWMLAPGAFCGLYLFNYLRKSQRSVVSLYPSQRDHHIPILNIPVELDEVWVGLGLLWNIGDLLLKLCHWTLVGLLLAAAAFALGRFSILFNLTRPLQINPFFDRLQLIPTTFFNALAGAGLLFIPLLFAYTFTAILNILSRQHPLGFGLERPSLQWIARIRTRMKPDPANVHTNRWRSLQTNKYTIRQIIAEVGWKGVLLLRHSSIYSSPTVLHDIADWMVTLKRRDSPAPDPAPGALQKQRRQPATLFDWFLWFAAGLVALRCFWSLTSLLSHLADFISQR